ncbi:hypothetical protein FBEOM_2562 [Fusarium beomiforme]|uniref:Fungal N-terminal domain-containing protein n=1 Tax=Fusarium beomiforme TaxID=44412 RepID=A0A9P5ARC6_9HYPO|nr:hypothetical protein FBEOM_2562 [Fusarium beomiforme]
MDPLSIIASIAGIASAGAQLSNTLFRLYKTVRHAPKEIQSVAIEMSGLTVTLEHLRDIITTGRAYAKPQFCDAVRHVVKNIETTQQEISKMVADETMLRRVKWRKAATFLSDIEKHKVTLTLQITILSAAVLVKSTSSRLSAQEKADNRFRAQAESLVLAGQASLQNDDEPEPIPEPPQERAPSPPVRTSKRLPSPVRESEIPGHVRTEELYGQTKETEENAPPSGDEKETAISVIARSAKEPLRQEQRYTFPAVGEKDEEEHSSGDEERRTRRRERSGFDPLSSGRIAQFGPDFHRRGDAATFLYNLVFLNEIPTNEEQYQDSYIEEDENGEKIEVRRRRHRHRERNRFLSEDSDLRPEFQRSRSEARVRFVQPKAQEPEKIVNRLLLAWTSLSESEVEKGNADTQPGKRRTYGQQASYDSDEWSLGERSEYEDSDIPQRRDRRRGHDMPSREEINYNNLPEFDPRGRRILRPTRDDTPGSGYANSYPRRADPSSTYGETTMPYGYNIQNQRHDQARESQVPYGSFTDQSSWNPGGPNPFSPYPVPPSSAEGYFYPSSQTYGPATETKATKAKFQKPDFVILPQADSGDSETGPTTPKLDLASINMGIKRQGDEPIWNCDNFMLENKFPGTAIMGALVGDRSARNPHGLDLAHTLMQGRSMKLVYIRGNDLGETWFINEKPVFLQFLHSGYLPQFYPAKEADERAMKEEYVAIGEEWASLEALQQLGLAIKRREEGRVLLDPSTTWKQGIEIPSLVVATDSETRAPIPDRRAKVEDEIEVEVLDFQVNDEPKQNREADKIPSQTVSSTLQPEISITPPQTPQQRSEADFEASEVVSHVSSGSRLSRFVKRYKAGGKKNLSLPLHRQSSKTSSGGSESSEWQDDGKRPLTPTDSGVGSSIISRR